MTKNVQDTFFVTKFTLTYSTSNWIIYTSKLRFQGLIRKFKNINIKLTISKSLFRSFIEYGISAWGRNKCSEIKQIHILQKRSIRLIDNSKATSHSDPLFLKYQILKINDLVDFNQAIFMYKYTHELLTASFKNIFKKL